MHSGISKWIAGITVVLEFQERMIMTEEWWSSTQKEDYVWVIYFKHRSMHKYTRLAKEQDGVELKSMIGLVLVKRDVLRYVQDARTVKGMGRGLSDHHIVLCKVRLLEAWIKRREVVVGARRIRSEKLAEHQYREVYSKSLEGQGVE